MNVTIKITDFFCQFS